MTTAATRYEPCKLGHRWACPHATALPAPEQRCFCGEVAWKDAWKNAESRHIERTYGDA